MITLTLLHPLQSVAVQSWTFHTESSIKIGRSTNNEVVLYSAVVSRHHVEIRKTGQQWEVINLGANGTYINGERIEQAPVTNGIVVRLASSGPKILIKIEPEPAEAQNNGMTKEQVQRKIRQKGAKDTLIS